MTVTLGDADAKTVFPHANAVVFVEVTDSSHTKTYPRQQFTSVPFAARVPVNPATLEFDANGDLTVKTGALGDVTLGTGKTLELGEFSSSPVCNAGAKGQIWFQGGNLLYCDGTAVQSLSTTGATGITASSTDTLTNKTFDADGTGNVITNLDDSNVKNAAGINANKIGGGTVDNTHFGYLAGVTSDLQAQIDAKASATPSFSTLSTGTNTTAAMTVGSGGSVLTSGTGVVEATKVKGSGSTTDAVDLATAEVAGTLPAANGGEATTASNVGTGQQVYKDEFLDDLRFRSLVGGTGVTITQNANDLTIDTTITQYTDALARTAAVADAINDNTTTIAPSQNAVFDALAAKINAADATATPTQNKIPIADGVGGALALGWFPSTLTGKDADTVDGINGASIVQTSRTVSAGTGLSGGGDLSANRTLTLDVNGLTAEVTADDADTIPIYDNSAGLVRKMTRANFLAGGAESDPQVGANTTNYLAKWDGSALVTSGVIDNAGNIGIGTNNALRPLHVSDVMRLEPRATEPSTPANGDVYVSSAGSDALCAYVGGSWKKVAGGGYCTTCGDGVLGGGEECDDGNADPWDGCSATCTNQRIPMTLGVLNTEGTGAKTTSFSANVFGNIATSSTASVTKAAVEVSSAGTWNGAGAKNIGIYVSSVTGGTNNYDAIFNGGGNVGIGTTTPAAKLDVNGQVKISGGSPGAGKVLISDASGLASWATVAAPVLIESKSGAGANAVNFTTGITSTYKKYRLEIINMRCTDSTSLLLRMSTDGGSSWASGASDYAWVKTYADSGTGGQGNGTDNDSYVALSDVSSGTTGARSISNDAGESLSGYIEFNDPGDSSVYKSMNFELGYMIQGITGRPLTLNGYAQYRSTSAVNGISLFMSNSGTINSGTFRLYGIP